MKEGKLEFIKVDNVLRHIVSNNIGPWGSTLMALTWKYKERLYLVKEIIQLLKFAAYFIS